MLRFSRKCSALGQWISWQRKIYQLMKSGKNLTTLTKEQIKLLNGIDFDWDGPVVYFREKKS